MALTQNAARLSDVASRCRVEEVRGRRVARKPWVWAHKETVTMAVEELEKMADQLGQESGQKPPQSDMQYHQSTANANQPGDLVD